jgi:phosphotransferase system enzyme I (PtsI)
MTTTPRILPGGAGAPGIAIGRVVRAIDPMFIPRHFRIPPEEVDREAQRFHDSVEKSIDELKGIQRELAANLNPESSFLIDAHLLILKDRLFVGRIAEKIAAEAINAEWAVQQVSDELYQAYDRLQDAYLRERRGDLEDIVRRLMHNLLPRHAADPKPTAEVPSDAVVVGRAIAPSVLFELRAHRIAGLVTETGSPLSHTAIVARSLGIPAVMGVEDADEISSGDLVIVDANRGIVIVSPDERTLREYRGRTGGAARAPAAAKPRASEPCVTADGTRIHLGANINFGEEVAAAAAQDAEFIGLYRTEFDFFSFGATPDENDLTESYVRAVDAARGMPVTFRTIDVGIDSGNWDEGPSHLGARGLRFCLANPELFTVQLRALYRAAQHGEVRILLPLVSTLDDLDAALEIIGQVRKDLLSRGEDDGRPVPIGVMIETPAAAETCDLMAPRVDFFCVGTNDLIQYYLVIDRSDHSMAELYSPFHPAILRCLRHIRALLAPSGKPVTVCGEMAADPQAAAVLLGLGFTAFSVSLGAYARIRQAIGGMPLDRVRELARRCLALERPKEVEDFVRTEIAAMERDAASGNNLCIG